MASQERLSEHAVFENVAGVGVWTVEDLGEAIQSGEIDEGEQHFREVAGQESMNGVVVEMLDIETASDEMLGHVNEAWTELAEATNIDGIAYVADGISRLAIANKNEAEGTDVRPFTDREDAIEWANEY